MYNARITRLNPTAFVFMIDQSGSMAENISFNSRIMTKAQAVSEVVNKSISELLYRCRRENNIADYFSVATLGYGNNKICSLLDPKKDFLKISQIAVLDKPRYKLTQERVLPNGTNTIVTTMQTEWIEPKAEGNTPMGECLDYVCSLAKGWCNQMEDSYPMMVFNISDGEMSDCSSQELKSKADALKSLSTNDGNVIFVNIHISSVTEGQSVVFPASKDELPSAKHAELLYEISSQMPKCYNQYISEIKHTKGRNTYKAMSFNASINDLFSMINIGSITVSLM